MELGAVRHVLDVEPVALSDEHAPTDVERIADAFDVPVELIGEDART